MGTSILAVVLTYDAPATVRRCVLALRAQVRLPDEVLVIDNAGAVPASQSLREGALDSAAVVHRTDANLGPAGGYAAGLQWFLDSRHDIAWVMDDDCEPAEDALAALERCAQRSEKPAVVMPTELDAPDGWAMNYPSWCGVWLPRSVVEQVGLPREDFFWWMEDTEYLRHRMRAAGIPVVREPTARVVHHRERRDGPVPVWKYYYETRNSTYVQLRLRVRGDRRVARWAWRTARRFGGLLLRGDLRAAKAGAFLQGLHDGLRGRLGKTFPVS